MKRPLLYKRLLCIERKGPAAASCDEYSPIECSPGESLANAMLNAFPIGVHWITTTGDQKRLCGIF